MAEDVQRYLQRCYIQLQSAFDSIPNTGGTATLAGSDCCLIVSLDTDATQAEIPRPDKTGTLDEMPAQGGRRAATGRLTMSMAGNGTAGTPPDCKHPLQAAFGKAPTINAGTSVVYGLGDNLYYLTIYNYNAPADATQMVLFNALVSVMEVSFGGDVPMLSFELVGGWVFDNDQAADASTPALAKGGLTTMPAEPATPVVNGTHPRGFDVTLTLDGTAYDSLQSGTIRVEVARSLRNDTNKEFPRSGAAGKRQVLTSLTMTDDNSATLRGTKQKAMKRTPVALSVAIGVTAGNIWTWALTGVALAKPKYGDAGSRRSVAFNQCHAYPSSLNAKDQLTLTIS